MTNQKKKTLPKVLFYLPAGVLLLGATPLAWMYWYGIFLKLVVAPTSVYLAWKIYRQDKFYRYIPESSWALIFSLFAIIYNPIIQIDLGGIMTTLLKVVAGIIFLFYPNKDTFTSRKN